jgi:origin recognition complex subunit 1
VLKKLRQESNEKKVKIFTDIIINGMQVTNVTNVFKMIYEKIFEKAKGSTVGKCMQMLDNFFKNKNEFDNNHRLKDPRNPHVVLIVDEIDCLINRKQTLLYNIFNWSMYPCSKLIIISISNTFDFPDKLLSKIKSRMGNHRLMFIPYGKEELFKIISVKIEDIKLFSDDALKLSSIKVAAVNGDLRRTLQICRRAKEIFESNKNKKHNALIDKKDIIQACNELFDDKLVKVIKSLQIYEKVIIATILFMKVDNGNGIRIGDLYDKKDFFLSKISKKLNFEEFSMIIYNLVKLKILNFVDGFNDNFIMNSVCIKFYIDEFMLAVEGDENFKVILDVLQKL